MDVFHIALRTDWNAAKAVGEYRISSGRRTLESEGFIHCCYRDQIAGVAERYWRTVGGDVCLLRIDPARLDAELIAENSAGGIELFPHLYGPLPVAAVVEVTELPRDAAGNVIPPAL